MTRSPFFPRLLSGPRPTRRHGALALALALLLQGCGGDDDATTAAAGNNLAAPTAGVPAGQTFDAATSTWQDLEGRGLELTSFAGKKVFINYWATWCAPCIREIPALNRAADALAAENYVFLLASDEPLARIEEFIAEREFGGHFIRLNTFFGAHGIDAVPSSRLYDEQGELLATWAGAYEWDSEEMLAEIRSATPADADTP